MIEKKIPTSYFNDEKKRFPVPENQNKEREK